MVRKHRGNYLAYPPELLHTVFARGVLELNLPCIMTVNSRIVPNYLSWCPNAVDLPVGEGLRVQVLANVEALPSARKAHCAAFIASKGLLLVWDDSKPHSQSILLVSINSPPDPNNVFSRAKRIEKELMALTWEAQVADSYNEKDPAGVTGEELDEESGDAVTSERPTHLLNTILVGFTLFLIMIMLGAGFRQIAIEVAVDDWWLRCAFILLTPVQIFFTLVRKTKPQDQVTVSHRKPVLRPSHHRLPSANRRTHQANARELALLLRHPPSPHQRPPAPARHHQVSRVQRRPGRGHRAHGQVAQTSYLDIRDAGCYCEYLRQR